MNRLIRPLAATLLSLATSGALAFPDRPITIIVPFNAGTTNDINARDLAQVLSAVAKQPVLVDNRAGAEGTLGGQALVNGPADGHTLMFSSNSLTVFDPLLKKNIPYDPNKDIVPICAAGRTNNLVNVSATGPYKSLADLIAAAKSQPGKLTFGYTSTSMRLAGELFQQASGTKLTGVPYRSSVTGLTDVSSGQVDITFIDRVSAQAFYDSGKIRPLAVSGPSRLSALPDVPSAKELGLPAYSVFPWFGVYASGKTPPDVLAQVRELVARAVTTPEMAANMEKRGLEPFTACGDALVKHKQQETEQWREVIRKAGIEPQ
ncbi:tripartite tricarboxylate transporter substrate binding protein [Variovorax defluvii]|uniref:Tripartite tricarboxylate transporter substrate binding protein n=1 Tax=Variovorax defluvii TaxID=913761 RepID=A0ABP8I8R1_9BURK